jgi:hypothetical protein
VVLIAWRGRYEGHASGADQTYEVEVKRVDTNQTMKFTVRELDTIEMVKGRIQHQWEIEIDRQHLVFNSGFLENTSTLADCQVIQGSQLYLAVKGEMPSDFKTSITGLDGRECTVEVNASDTVFMFRSKIEAKLVNTSDTVVPRLIFEGTGSVNTLLAPDRAPKPLAWRVAFLRDEENMSTKLQISFESDSRMMEMESSKTILEVMSQIQDQEGIPSFESDSRMMEIEGSKTILEVMSQIQDQEGIPADQLPRIFSLWSCRRPRTTTPVRGAKKKKKKEPPDGEAAGGGSTNKRRRSGEANAVGEAAQKKNETKKKKKPLKLGGKRGVEAQPAARSAAVSELEDSMLGLAVVGGGGGGGGGAEPWRDQVVALCTLASAAARKDGADNVRSMLLQALAVVPDRDRERATPMSPSSPPGRGRGEEEDLVEVQKESDNEGGQIEAAGDRVGEKQDDEEKKNDALALWLASVRAGCLKLGDKVCVIV